MNVRILNAPGVLANHMPLQPNCSVGEVAASGGSSSCPMSAIPTKGFSLGEIFVGFVNFAKHNCRFSAKKQCC